MPTIHASGTIAGLKRLRVRIAEAATLTLRDAEEAAIASARGTTLFKDRSGGTRQSIGRGRQSLTSGTVEARGAAHFLEGGTRAHTITAKSGGMLRFTVNGQVLYRRFVHHPGTRPRPFMHAAREAAVFAAEMGALVHMNAAIAGV